MSIIILLVRGEHNMKPALRSLLKIIVTFIMIITIGLLVVYWIFIYNPLLTQSFDSIDKVIIESHLEDKSKAIELTFEKNKAEIYKIYQEVKKTKIKNYPFANEVPQNDKIFTIKFKYKNGKFDIIEPCEVYYYIYKAYPNGTGFSVGYNKNVADIITEISK